MARTLYEKSEPERDRRKSISSARKDILHSQILMDELENEMDRVTGLYEQLMDEDDMEEAEVA